MPPCRRGPRTCRVASYGVLGELCAARASSSSAPAFGLVRLRCDERPKGHLSLERLLKNRLPSPGTRLFGPLFVARQLGFTPAAAAPRLDRKSTHRARSGVLQQPARSARQTRQVSRAGSNPVGCAVLESCAARPASGPSTRGHIRPAPRRLPAEARRGLVFSERDKASQHFASQSDRLPRCGVDSPFLQN